MSREGHLEGRREDAQARRGLVCRQHERGLGQVELEGERLHGRVIEAAAVLEDAQRIAAERALREDIDDAEGVAHRTGSGAVASKAATISCASAFHAAASMARGTNVRAWALAGKLPSIERR